MTHQSLWVILCRLPEKGRNEIKEIIEEMKERGAGKKGPLDSYQILPKYVKGYQSYGMHKDENNFFFRGDNYIMNRVVSLACGTHTGPLYPYQILSYYLKQHRSYGLHKILASGEITTPSRKILTPLNPTFI